MLTLELLHENRLIYPVRKPPVVDQGIMKFLVALFEAEKAGSRTDIHKIGFHDVETALSVFKRCKAQFLVRGSPDAAWITPSGKEVIGQD